MPLRCSTNWVMKLWPAPNVSSFSKMILFDFYLKFTPSKSYRDGSNDWMEKQWFKKKKKNCPCKFYWGNFATHWHGTRQSLWKGEGMVGEESVRTKHGPGVHRPRILDQVHGPPQLGPCPPQQKKLKQAENSVTRYRVASHFDWLSRWLSNK